MTTKEYLRQAQLIDEEINGKLKQVAELRDMATSVTSMMSDMPRSASRNVHKMEDTIAKLVDLEMEVDADIDRLVDLKKEIAEMVDRLPSQDQRVLLMKRYLQNEPWENIAVEMGYSLRSIFRLHGEALQSAEKIKVGSKWQ
ncbi:MAG: DUF1492 domain-containing protein [Victivallales bacterium]|nr:DUF1492 domain-containing protein [Victivallales bacterium]